MFSVLRDIASWFIPAFQPPQQQNPQREIQDITLHAGPVQTLPGDTPYTDAAFDYSKPCPPAAPPDIYDASKEKIHLRTSYLPCDKQLWKQHQLIKKCFANASPDNPAAELHFSYDGGSNFSLDYLLSHDPVRQQTIFKHVCYSDRHDISSGILLTDKFSLNEAGDGFDHEHLASRHDNINPLDDDYARKLFSKAASELGKADMKTHRTPTLRMDVLCGFVPKTVYPAAWLKLG